MIDTALIVAGGLGTRLRPLTETTPKPLLPIRGKPIIEHVIRNLKKHGIKNIIISIGYKAEQVQEYFGDGNSWGVSISYALETEPLGTGGAVKLASKHLAKPFFLVWGDNLMDVSFSRMEQEFLSAGTPLIMALTHREDVENFGVAKLDKNKIITFVEKPKREDAPSTLINAGAFIIDPSCLSLLPEGKSSIEKDCFEKLAPLGKIAAFIHRGQWFPTDTLEKYHHANAFFAPNIDFKEKKVIIADVDDTICDTCQLISPKMAEQISRMIKQGYEFAFISGTKSEDLQKMISSKVKEKHHLLATTGTNYAIVEDENVSEVRESASPRSLERGLKKRRFLNPALRDIKGTENHSSPYSNMGLSGPFNVHKIYNYSFTSEEKKEIVAALKKLISHYGIKSLTTEEDQLQDRDSQITLSAIGRNAPSEMKANYDPSGEKRKKWVEFLKQFLNEDKYELKIGGTTSIDITQKGLDKEWGIKAFARYHNLPLSSILFFGDKIHPGGNDFPATKIVDCISVRSPQDTLQHLRALEILNAISATERPWGNFEQFTANELSTVKILEVKPQQRLSLQSHQHREELWIALDDGVIAEINGLKHYLNKGDKMVVPKESKHRLSSESGTVRVLEIAFGNFDENDITRYEDDFGRV
ncbi:MAG: sugar phosphate nucleotidyltransferase [Nanoarchaeota archaeon]|mgnify:CR=1 FL=1